MPIEPAATAFTTTRNQPARHPFASAVLHTTECQRAAYCEAMTEFVIDLVNRPGSLARVTRLLADAGVNVETLAAWGADGDAIVRLVVDNADAARRVFAAAGLRTTEHTVLTARLPHRPGALAELTGALADAAVNIDAMYVLRSNESEVEIALAVDQPEAADRGLQVVGAVTLG